MTPHTLTLTIPFAGRLGGSTNCVSPNATDIYIAQDYITGETLAHEWGHGLQAEYCGWRYLPWIAWCFLTQGYEKSDAEKSADRFMMAHAHLFPSEVRCPDDL